MCISEQLDIKCQSGEVIFLDTAQYGRMDTGKCLAPKSQNMGCENDVLHLVDHLCSGLLSCKFSPYQELQKTKMSWCGDLISYFRVGYSCTQGKKTHIMCWFYNTAINSFSPLV